MNNVIIGNTGGNTVNTSGSTNTLDWCNLTSFTTNLCSLGNGTLAFNTFQPHSGVTTTMTSTGNTALALSSSGAGRQPYTWFLDASGKINLYDETLAVTQFSIDNAGAAVFTQSTSTGTTATVGTGVRFGNASGPSITFAAGAPAGACITGSLYLRTNGGAGSTIYACESAAWDPLN
jgi:hypothetical protein